MHLCFSCISYLSFGTEIAEETKTQTCKILTNNNGGSYQLYGAICYIFQTLLRQIAQQKKKATHHVCKAT